MNKRLFQLTLLVGLIFIASYSIALFTNPTTQQNIPDFRKPSHIINLYYQAVDNGELTIFEQKLDRSMITPLHVEYRYKLDSDIPSIKVFSKLNKEVPIPAHPNCVATGITALLSLDGHISKTEVHVTRCD